MAFTDMSDAELEAHIVAAMDERARRRVVADAPRKARELTVQVLDAEGVTEGEPWRPVVLGYPEGHTVTHPVPGTSETGTWTSMLDNNTWEPGSAGGGWRLQPPGDGRPALWVRPSSTMDAYQDGDMVMFPDYETGKTYRSTWPNPNTWAPDEFPDAWELVEDTAPTPEEPDPEPDPEPEPEPDPDPGDGGDGDEVPVWERPLWAGEEGGAYAHGERVRYPDANSPIYRSTFDGWNTWSPSEYPDAWEREG